MIDSRVEQEEVISGAIAPSAAVLSKLAILQAKLVGLQGTAISGGANRPAFSLLVNALRTFEG